MFSPLAQVGISFTLMHTLLKFERMFLPGSAQLIVEGWRVSNVDNERALGSHRFSPVIGFSSRAFLIGASRRACF